MNSKLHIRIGSSSFTGRSIKAGHPEKIFSGMLDALGLGAEVEIQFADQEEFLSVNDQVCRYPPSLPEEVETYIRFLETYRKTESDTEYWEHLLQNILWLQPQVLFTEYDLMELMPALDPLSEQNKKENQRRCKEIIAELLQLKISLKDKGRIQDISNHHLNLPETDWNEFREELIETLSSGEIGIFFNDAYFDQLMTKGTGDNLFEMMRDGLFYETGLNFHPFRIFFDTNLPGNAFYFKVNSFTSLPFIGLTDANEVLVSDSPDKLAALGITGRGAINPANGNASAIIHKEDKDKAERSGLMTWDELGYFILTFSGFLRKYGYKSIDRKFTDQYLDTLKLVYPKIVELTGSEGMLSICPKILRLLAREGISIRNLRVILSAMLESNTIIADANRYIIFDDRIPVPDEDKADWKEYAENVVEFVRTRLKEYISYKYTRGQSTLVVYLLDPEIERLADTDITSFEFDGQDTISKILRAVELELGSLPASAQVPVILTTINVRSRIKEILTAGYPQVAVLSYQELSPETNIQPIARISLS